MRPFVRAGKRPAGADCWKLAFLYCELDRLLLFGRIDDGDGHRRCVGRERRGYVERLERAIDVYRDRAESLTIELQHQSRGFEFGVRLGGLDTADDVDRLSIIRHEVDVTVAEELVEPDGDAQTIL